MERREPRGALAATIDVGGRRCTCWRRISAFASTSGGFRSARSSNISTRCGDTLFVVLGDFNDWLPGRSVVHVLDQRLGQAASSGVVSGRLAGRAARSHLGASDGGAAAGLRARDAGRAIASDHLPVVADIDAE